MQNILIETLPGRIAYRDLKNASVCTVQILYAIKTKVIPEGWAVIVTAQPSGTTLIKTQ